MTDRIIAFDTEMPGQKEMRLSAIGITVIENGEITDKIFHLINPETDFDPYVVKLIGITPEMVKNKPTFPEIWEKIKDVMSSGLLVAHGATGDMMALCGTMKHYGIAWKDTVQYSCTCDMGIKCYEKLAGYSLDVLCDHIGFKELSHHNALSDSEGCARLYLDYLEKGINPEEFIYTFDTVRCVKIRPRKIVKRKTLPEKIRRNLFSMSENYVKKAFLKKHPHIDEEKVVGVREGRLRQYAVRLMKSGRGPEFLRMLPHAYHEENNLHAIILSGSNKFSLCVDRLQKFLPFVDNKETLELIRPKVFKGGQQEISGLVTDWISSEHNYTVMFAINVIMNYCLSDETVSLWLSVMGDLKAKDILVREKRAEFFAKALMRFENETTAFMKTEALDKWTHNMAVQIAAFSKGVDEETRERLQSLRR